MQFAGPKGRDWYANAFQLSELVFASCVTNENIRFLLIGKMHGRCTKVARNPNMERLRNNYLFPEVGGLLTSRYAC